MARLIIGHTTNNSTRIWVRGGSGYPVAFVTLAGGGASREKIVELEERHGFTGVADYSRLGPNTAYNCSVSFGENLDTNPKRRVQFGNCEGQVTTFPNPGSRASFRFLLGSCNLHSLGVLSSPNRAFEILSEVADAESAAFMLHCGDQIYYDVPNYWKSPDVEEYREKYLDAWSDSRPTRKFLTEIPHYMILDDHEMTNNFTNDMDSSRTGATPTQIRDASLKVYREFQHIRHPGHSDAQALYYSFSHGRTQFFVMDTRSERYEIAANEGRMVGDKQMRAIKSWLRRHKNASKFIVTAVPFVGQVTSSDDKWCGIFYNRQRESIIDFIADNEIRRVVFLTGDMHNSYHASLTVSTPTQELVIHELMSSPINQIGKSSIDHYDQSHSARTHVKGYRYRVSLRSNEFYSDSSNAMLIEVDGGKVSYEIFRTKKDERDVISGSFVP